MPHPPPRRWSVGLAAALVLGAALDAAPAHAQPGPVVIPPIAPVVVGVPGHGRAGVTWSKSGRASVEIDVDLSRHHGQAVAR